MVELVTLVNDDLRRFAPFNAVDVPGKAIYRLYRDTRFSNDKTPYKTHTGATFPRATLPKHGGAGFYFGVSHRCVEIAGGVYMPGPEELTVLRGAVAADPKGFLEVAAAPKLVRSMGKITGESLKRVPKGYEAYADSPVADVLKLKQMYWFVELPADLALTPDVRREVVTRFRLMADALDWMNRVLLAARAAQEDADRPVRPAPMF
jgi:uncharacterized protein (TIGR02453 family)